MAIVIGLIFFLAVGYFAYTFGQCVAKFSRLDKLIDSRGKGSSIGFGAKVKNSFYDTGDFSVKYFEKIKKHA